MATITITTPAEQDQRILNAFGVDMNLGRAATGAEVKQALVRFMKEVVRRVETQAALAAANVTDVTPT